ncbi:hypothetical protein [Roseisolibacter agri]|uniref:Uncharacterized protein n=1 Tax=Roseisolibacter agri TaxID=2014610 RepID=A0AA37V1D4_9BACT|nr:hypothetical protein [Roseisolibacter agri]GLC26005.1 hypothetical protein rosag_25180 [Roseisolibacter agri]
MPRPSRSAQLFSLVALAALVAVLIGGTRALLRLWDRVEHPWAYGDRPLAGQWTGRVTSGGGRTQTVYLELERKLRESGRQEGLPTRCGAGPCEAIDGLAMTCDATRRARTLTVTGWPLARDGSRFRLLLVPADSPSVDGLTLGSVEARWDGADTIEADAGFVLRRGVSAIRDGGDPDTGRPARLVLHRGTEDEFRRACP